MPTPTPAPPDSEAQLVRRERSQRNVLSLTAVLILLFGFFTVIALLRGAIAVAAWGCVFTSPWAGLYFVTKKRLSRLGKVRETAPPAPSAR